jgi:hypothetical protein
MVRSHIARRPEAGLLNGRPLFLGGLIRLAAGNIFIAISALLLAPHCASAQESNHQPGGLGYVFVGPATHQMNLTAGFGGEGYFYKGVGAGAEVATAGFDKSTNGNHNWIGMGSADVSYHLFTKRTQDKLAPFVTGGYALFFGQDTDAGTGSVAHGFNVGGGLDLFASKHVGARFDVRYYAHGDHILWASFPNVAQLSFAAFRVGLTFK